MIYERVRQLLDSVATKEEKKINIIYKGENYTLEEYATIVIPRYVVVNGQELLVKTKYGYIRVEEYLCEIIYIYKIKIQKTEELPETFKNIKSQHTPAKFNDRFKKRIETHPNLSKMIYDKDFMLKVIKESNNLKTIWYQMPHKFREDEEFMYEAIKYDSDNYNYADPELKRQKRFAIKCANIDGMILEQMEGTYNKDISYEPDVDSLGNVFNTAEYHYTHKSDCDVVATAVRQNPEAIKFAEFNEFKINNPRLGEESIEYTNKVKQIMIYVISIIPELYDFTPETLKDDEEIINAYNISKQNVKQKRLK